MREERDGWRWEHDDAAAAAFGGSFGFLARRVGGRLTGIPGDEDQTAYVFTAERHGQALARFLNRCEAREKEST